MELRNNLQRLRELSTEGSFRVRRSPFRGSADSPSVSANVPCAVFVGATGGNKPRRRHIHQIVSRSEPHVCQLVGEASLAASIYFQTRQRPEFPVETEGSVTAVHPRAEIDGPLM
ncbi:hypothetical protein ZHAS_00006063 [Anopheles sinensis]|uniref:Uncharacterized protein n=1 Tax=Anopheles sinensis TaxID=74873 RepID=A0A084VL25_ANOSI|nr:hypothetical protein ZHAS_00006063 [Anopheles sinensis]